MFQPFTGMGMVNELASAIVARKRDGQVLRVGIDGRCAAGKTMLAEELVGALCAQGLPTIRRSSVDEFHHPREVRHRQGEYSAIGYYEDAYDYAAVAAHLRNPSEGVLVFEGLFLFRPELDAYCGRRCGDIDRARGGARHGGDRNG